MTTRDTSLCGVFLVLDARCCGKRTRALFARVTPRTPPPDRVGRGGSRRQGSFAYIVGASSARRWTIGHTPSPSATTPHLRERGARRNRYHFARGAPLRDLPRPSSDGNLQIGAIATSR